MIKIYRNAYFFKIAIVFLLVSIPPFLIASAIALNVFLKQSAALIYDKNDNELVRTGALLEQILQQLVDLAESGVTDEQYTRTGLIMDQINLLKHISKTVSDHNYLDSLYIYNMNENYVFVSNYGIIREISGTPYEWIATEAMGMTSYQIKMSDTRLMHGNARRNYVVPVLAKLPLKSETQYVLIYNIDIEKIYADILLQLNANPDIYNYYLTDRMDNIVFHRDPQLIHAHDIRDPVADERIVVSRYKLESTNWNLVREINDYNLFHDVNVLRTRMLILLALTATVIVAAVMLGARELYKPIRKITSQTADLVNVTLGRLGEFERISSAFETMMLVNRNLNSKLGENERLLKSTLLRQLMKERYKNTIDVERYLADYQTQLAVALFALRSGGHPDIDRHEVAEQLRQAFKDKFKADVFVDSDHEWIVLFRLDHEDLNAFIVGMVICLEDKLLEKMSLSIGGIHPLEQIRSAYTEALYASNMGRIYSPQTNIYGYNNLPIDYQNQNIHDPAIEQLELAVRQHDEEAFASLLDRMIREDISVMEYNYNIYMNISLLIKLYDQDSVVFLQEINELITDKGMMSAATVKHFFHTKYREYNAGYGSDINEYIKKIDRYVAANYQTNFSLDDIADHVGITKQYICTIYKQHYNTTLVDQISQYRVEKAKQMLGDRTMKIAEIGFSVGFNSNSYFTKVFKHYSGITPSEYRELSLRRAASVQNDRE